MFHFYLLNVFFSSATAIYFDRTFNFRHLKPRRARRALAEVDICLKRAWQSEGLFKCQVHDLVGPDHVFNVTTISELKDPKDSRKHIDVTAYISKKDASL